MRQPFLALLNMVPTRDRQKLLRYFLASMVNVVIGEVILGFAFGYLHWSARSAALLAATIAAIPAYVLARRWVWGRSGRSHLFKEVLPFWTLALLGLALTAWVAGVAESVGDDLQVSRLAQTAIVMGSVLGVSGAFWVVRFLVLNRFLFADRSAVDERDGQAGAAYRSGGERSVATSSRRPDPSRDR